MSNNSFSQPLKIRLAFRILSLSKWVPFFVSMKKGERLKKYNRVFLIGISVKSSKETRHSYIFSTTYFKCLF